jgi:hypothetical protein
MKPNSSSSRVDAPSLNDRKAQYAAWKDRIMTREDDDIEVRPDDTPSKWSVEALFAGLPVD